MNRAANQLKPATQNTDVPHGKNTPQTITGFLQNFSQILVNGLPKTHTPVVEFSTSFPEEILISLLWKSCST